MAFTPLTEVLGTARAAHLLRRTVFGATIDEINEFANYTPQQAIAILIKNGLPEPVAPIDPSTGQEWMEAGTTDANSEGFDLERYFLMWHLGQYLGGKSAPEDKLAYIFRERLVFWLHTLFTTKKSVVGNSRSLYFQNALFRKFAFDADLTDVNDEPLNFKSLTKKVSVDNAMLRFLDGRLNVKGSPNENYARELLELYSIGRGLEGSVPEATSEGDYIYYMEADVQAAAKVLSGFNTDNDFAEIDEDTGLPTGIIKGGAIASSHDNSEKTFSMRFNNATVAPDPELMPTGEPTRESVMDEIQQLIDIIYSSEETPKHICRKLYRFFVYHEITETIDNTLIADMADIFVSNDYKIQPVLETLFTSQEFYSGAAGYQDDVLGSIIKSPIDLVMGHARTFGVTLPDYETDYDSFYEIMSPILQRIDRMGLSYYEPFEVAGYSAYHQYPIYNRGWITTTYLTERYDYMKFVTSNEMMDMGLGISTPVAFVQNHFNSVAANARDLVIELCKYFFPVSSTLSFDDASTSEITPERLSYFLFAFLETFAIDEFPEDAWNTRWTNGVDMETVQRQLQDLFNAILQSPEYQLM